MQALKHNLLLANIHTMNEGMAITLRSPACSLSGELEVDCAYPRISRLELFVIT